MNLKELQEQKEGPCFERKSIMMDPKALAVPLVAFANADGGTIAVGINDAGEIEGVDGHERQVNELLRVPFDFCKPTVKADFEYVPCKDRKGRPNRVLVLNVRQSQNVHATQADEVFYRVGDKSKRLTFDERMQLLYDKGDRFYEDTPVAGATADELDLKLVKAYTKRIGYSKPPLTYLRENNGFLQDSQGQEKVSAAAVLLFGKAPQNYFPRARVRFIRYEGTDEKTGAQMNVIKDVSFEGTILETVQKAIAFVSTQIKDHTYLAKGGLFVTDSEYPEFVRQEIIVNAVAHRDYSIKGTDIQVKMFDDRLVVESPGTLPGLVRLNTMRKVHFSRNPKIAAFLKDYGFVKEFGEGIDRMCKELKESGLPDPEYQVESFMLRCTVRAAEVIGRADGKGTENGKPPSLSANIVKTHDGVHDGVHDIHLNRTEQQFLACLKTPGTTPNILLKLGYPRRTRNYESAKNRLLALSLIEMTIPDKPRSKNQKYRLTSKGQALLVSLSAK